LGDNASFCTNCGVAAPPDRADDLELRDIPADGAEGRLAADVPVVSNVGMTGETLPIPENVAGVIAYITFVPAVFFLFLKPFKRNPFVRFHSFQNLFLWVAGLACMVAGGVLGAILQLIPFMRVLVFPFAGLLGLAWFFLWILLVVKAYRHEMFKLPYLGDLAEEWMNRQ